jgi:hypothetical protein
VEVVKEGVIHESSRDQRKPEKKVEETTFGVEGNVIHAAPIFNFCSCVREIAWRALPNGKAMNLTRPQIEAAWGGPQDWYYFSGMKPEEDKCPMQHSPLPLFQRRIKKI